MPPFIPLAVPDPLPGLGAVLAAGAYGALAGLLLVPRAAHRLAVEPETPWRADCPAGHPLTGPAAGWFGRARCPACPRDRARYGPAPVRTALGTALLCALLAAAIGPRPELLAYVTLAPVLVLLTLVDRAVRRLPDLLTLPLAAALLLLLGLAAPLPAAAGAWSGALLGGLALAAGYLLLHVVNPAGLGFGDVKLALPLGVALGWYGWGVWALGGFLGFLYGAGYGLSLVTRGRAGRRTAFAFGPFMVAGALTGVLLGALAS
ncbi:prepilin peptidase [Streptomyces sp. BI20]|uniref:prepilin peptidase n=1 Tax=Streptomyces sp. BI20 TaxID=3403460 RepID=UPI003C72A61B